MIGAFMAGTALLLATPIAELPSETRRAVLLTGRILGGAAVCDVDPAMLDRVNRRTADLTKPYETTPAARQESLGLFTMAARLGAEDVRAGRTTCREVRDALRNLDQRR